MKFLKAFWVCLCCSLGFHKYAPWKPSRASIVYDEVQVCDVCGFKIRRQNRNKRDLD